MNQTYVKSFIRNICSDNEFGPGAST